MAGKITLVAVFYNEERKLPGYFRNVEGVVDEMVLVDCGSTDSTAKLCKAGNARLIESGVRYFEQNVNKALAKVSTEWVLVLDADERLGPELKRSVRKAALEGGADVYKIKRINFTFDGFCRHETKNVYLPRLFRKGHVRWEKEVPHETPAVDGKVAVLHGEMYHYAHVGVGYWLAKASDYLNSMVPEYRKTGTKTINIGERVGAVSLLFGSHGLRRMFIFPPVQVANYLFRHRLLLDGMRGVVFSVCQGIYAFLEEAIYWNEASLRKSNAAIDWAREYPDRE